MTSPDTLAQTIRDAHRRIVEEAGAWPTRAWNEALIVEAITDAAVALDSLLDMAREAATLREALERIAPYDACARAALAAAAPRGDSPVNADYSVAEFWHEWDALTEPERQALRDAQDVKWRSRRLTLARVVQIERPDVWARIVAVLAGGGEAA